MNRTVAGGVDPDMNQQASIAKGAKVLVVNEDNIAHTWEATNGDDPEERDVHSFMHGSLTVS